LSITKPAQVYRKALRTAIVLTTLCVTFHVAFSFERNAGQVHDGKGDSRPDVHFIHRSNNYSVLLLSNGFSYQFQNVSKAEDPLGETGFQLHFHRIDVTFDGALPNPTLQTSSPRYRNTFYREHETRFISDVVDTVIYHQMYEGVDIRFVSTERSFKYDIICADREALERVKLHFQGQLGPLEVSKSGELIFSTVFGSVAEQIPVSFMESDNAKRSVEVLPWVNRSGNTVGFTMDGPWPAGERLVIDPVPHLLWSTYAGGDGMDELQQVELDDDGNIYVSGFTTSLNTIATSGAHQGTLAGFQNCFLQKYSPQGQKLFGTYFGGQSADRCYGMTRESATGNIYLSGSTFSAGVATAGTHQQALASPDDGLLVKFTPDGNLLWATYFGGHAHDFIAQLDVDIHGNLLMTGHTRSTNGISTDLTFLPGNENTFIAKFSPDGQQLWGTYLGGTFDEGWGIDSDADGSIFVAGETSSTSGISTPGSHQPALGGALDAFLVKYDTHGQRLWGTYIGGSGNDRATALKVCADGAVAVVGNTESAIGIASISCHQTQPGSLDDAFLIRFSPTGERLWGTYVGGEGVEYLTSVDETSDGSLVIAGQSESLLQVTSPSAFQPQPAGEYDALLMRFSAEGAFQWGTYLGGAATDYANDVAYGPVSAQVVMVGMTRSTEGVASQNAQQEDYLGGLYDGFMARFCIPPTPTVVTPDGLSACGDDILRLMLSAEGLNAQWSNGQQGSVLQFSPPSEGAHVISADVTDAYGCPGRSDTVTVQAFTAFEPGLNIVADPLACIGVPTVLSLSGTFASQTWWDGSTGITANFTPSDGSEHWLQVTVFNVDGCAHTDSVAVQAVLCVSVPTMATAASPTLFPIPSSGSFTLRWADFQGQQLAMSIFAMDGRLAHRTAAVEGEWFRLSLAPGTYLAEFSNPEGSVLVRIPMIIVSE